MTVSRCTARILAPLAVVVSVFSFTLNSVCGSNTWDGGGTTNNWNDPLNWDNDLVPAFPVSIDFTGSLRPTPNNNIANVTLQGITFDGSAAVSFTVGGNAVTLSGGPVNLPNANGIENSSPVLQTVNLGLTLGTGAHYFTTDLGAGGLTLGGPITPQTAAVAAFNTYGGPILSPLQNNASTGIIGGWATVSPSNSAGTAGSWAMNDGTGNIIGYTVPTANQFNAGDTVNVSDPTANIQFNGGGNLTVAAGTQLNTLLYADTGTTARTITLSGAVTFANGGGIYKNVQTAAVQQLITGGSITAGTNGPATLYLRTLNNSEPLPAAGPPEALSITSPITDNGSAGGAVTVVKSGFGVLRLNGTNTFTGGLYVDEGQVRPALAGSMGASTSPVYVANGAQILQGGAVNEPNPLFIAGTGPNEGTFSGGALRFNSAGGTFSGPITLIGDADITARGGQAASTATGGTLSGQISGNFSLSLNQFSGQGTSGLTASMPSITLTNPANNWGGNTVIGRGRVRIGANEVIPNTSNLIMFGEAASQSILSLDSHTETVNGLSSAVGDNTSLEVVTNTVAGLGVLNVGSNNGSGSYAGVLTDSTGTLQLGKLGTGTQTLSGTNTYSGGTMIYNGTLALGADAALPPTGAVSLGGDPNNLNSSGTLDLAGFNPTIAGLSTAGTGTANIIGNSSSATTSTLTFAGGATPTVFGGKIQDTLPGGNQKVALAITSGTLTLGGSNTFTGGAMVNGGTLSVTGSLVAANTVTVNSGAMLTGNGNGSTTGLAGTVSVNGGTVYPGTTPGDIAKLATSSLSIHNGGLMIDLGPSFTSDQVKDLGALTIGDPGGAAPTLSVVGTPANGSYEIIDYSGSLAKNVDFNVTGPLGFGYTLNYATPGKVFLNVAAITTTLTWNGAADQTSWDTAHANFNNGTSNVAYSDPNPVVFSDTAPASATTINISNTVNPLSVTVNSSTRNYTFQGSGGIGGGGSLIKSGSSTLTILNNNTYTGTTTINAGTIQVGNGSASGSLGSGAITNNGSLVYNRSDSVTISNAISGSGTFRQAGSGTVILAGSNSYTDATVISSGTLQVGDGTTNGNLGTGNVANSVTLVFDRSDAVVVPNNITLTGAASTLVQNSTAGTGSTTINGSISGAGKVQVNSGTLTLGGTNTYGNTTISSGATLQIGAGGTSGTLGTGALTNQGTLVFNRSDALTVNGAIGDIGNVQQAGSGTTTFNAANTYSGMTIITGGTLAVGAGGTLGNGTNDLFFGNGTAGTGGLDLTNKSVTVNNLTANSNSPNTSTITIGAGKTLTVTGNVLVGGFTVAANVTADNPITNLAVTGGGALVLGTGTGGTLIIDNLKNNNTGGGDTTNAKVDLSGLSTFTANYLGGTIGVGAGANGVGGNAPFGQLILANTNTLTASTFNVGINNGGGNTSKSSVSLGTTNIINVDALNVGAGKTQTSPTVTGSINFRAGLTNPTVTLRGSDGVSRVASMVVGAGNLNANGSGTGMGGTVDLTAGTVDAMIDNLKVGVGANSSTGTSLGNLLFNAGTINANELTIGQQGNSTGSPATGTVTIGGGNLVVNGGSDGFAILLGNKPNAAGAGAITGNLNINGGSVSVAGDVFGGTGVSNLTLNSGTLDIQGHNLGVAAGSSNPVNGNPTGPITTLNFQAGTLKNVAEINGGANGLTKTGTGTLTISGNNTYSGPTTVTQGTLTLGNNNAIKAGAATPVSSLVLNGGTFATGGFSDTLGTLTLAANSILDLGAGTSVLHFASSNDTLDGVTWSGSTLTVNNWSGTPGTGGGTDEIFVGSSATGLSAAQLAKIQFTGFSGIKLLGTGEVVPLTASAQFLLGDINQDNHVNAADITAMLTALTDLNAYRALHPTLSDANVLSIADINGDGKWNNADIQFLIGYLQAGHGSATAVPEPATLILAVVGLLAGLTIRRGKPLAA